MRHDVNGSAGYKAPPYSVWPATGGESLTPEAPPWTPRLPETNPADDARSCPGHLLLCEEPVQAVGGAIQGVLNRLQDGPLG